MGLQARLHCHRAYSNCKSLQKATIICQYDRRRRVAWRELRQLIMVQSLVCFISVEVFNASCCHVRNNFLLVNSPSKFIQAVRERALKEAESQARNCVEELARRLQFEKGSRVIFILFCIILLKFI